MNSHEKHSHDKEETGRDQPEDRFVAQAQEVLRKSEDDLDGYTLSRLNQARQRALEQLESPKRAWLTQGAWGMAVAMVVVVVMVAVFWQPTQEPEGDLLLADGGDAVLIAEDLEFLEQLDFPEVDDAALSEEEIEFYAWLAEQETS